MARSPSSSLGGSGPTPAQADPLVGSGLMDISENVMNGSGRLVERLVSSDGGEVELSGSDASTPMGEGGGECSATQSWRDPLNALAERSTPFNPVWSKTSISPTSSTKGNLLSPPSHATSIPVTVFGPLLPPPLDSNQSGWESPSLHRNRSASVANSNSSSEQSDSNPSLSRQASLARPSQPERDRSGSLGNAYTHAFLLRSSPLHPTPFTRLQLGHMLRILNGLSDRVEQLELAKSAQELEIARLKAALDQRPAYQTSNGHSLTNQTISPISQQRQSYQTVQLQSSGLVACPPSPTERFTVGTNYNLPSPASPATVGFSPVSPYSSYIPTAPPLTRANTFNDFTTSSITDTTLNGRYIEGGVSAAAPGIADRYDGTDPFDFAVGGAINAGPGMGFFPGGMLSASPSTTNPRRSRLRSASEGLQLQPQRPRGASFSAIAPIVAQAKWMAQQQPVLAGAQVGGLGVSAPPPEHINYRALVEHDLEIDADVGPTITENILSE